GTSLGVEDTMALISSKLSKIVPVSSSALFLHSDDQDALECRYASGPEASHILELKVRSGHGLAGWVARNRRPLVNARPSAEFEAAGRPRPHTQLRSALVCPLIVNQRFIGALAVYHSNPSAYTEDHRRLLDRVSEQAAA